MPQLKFYDVRTKTSFTTDKYTIRKTKNGRKQAVAKKGNLVGYRFV